MFRPTNLFKSFDASKLESKKLKRRLGDAFSDVECELQAKQLRKTTPIEHKPARDSSHFFSTDNNDPLQIKDEMHQDFKNLLQQLQDLLGQVWMTLRQHWVPMTAADMKTAHLEFLHSSFFDAKKQEHESVIRTYILTLLKPVQEQLDIHPVHKVQALYEQQAKKADADFQAHLIDAMNSLNNPAGNLFSLFQDCCLKRLQWTFVVRSATLHQVSSSPSYQTFVGTFVASAVSFFLFQCADVFDQKAHQGAFYQFTLLLQEYSSFQREIELRGKSMENKMADFLRQVLIQVSDVEESRISPWLAYTVLQEEFKHLVGKDLLAWKLATKRLKGVAEQYDVTRTACGTWAVQTL